jgi:uncharacterized membrane protein HdeD (DUF308 family)
MLKEDATVDARPAGAGDPTWVGIFIGVISILFGLVCLFWPGISLAILATLFGVFVLIWGLAELIAAYSASRAGHAWWSHLLFGLIGLIAGVVVFTYPGVTAFVLLGIIAYWAVVLGVFQIILSFGTGSFLWVVTGLIALLFGFALLANSAAGAVGLVALIGLFAIIEGVVLLAGAIRPPVARPSL